MKRLGASVVLPFCLIALSGSAVAQGTHDSCANTRDYEGCMRYRGASRQSTYSNTRPSGGGFDLLGMPKIPGWNYQPAPSLNTAIYSDPTLYKLKVRGSYGRYIHSQGIARRYRNASPGTSGTSLTIGSERTNCDSTAYINPSGPYSSYRTGSISTNCTTTPATTINIPGRAAVSAGIVQISMDTVFDCEERTVGIHMDRKLKGGWKKLSMSGSENSLALRMSKSCYRVNSLPASSFLKYE